MSNEMDYQTKAAREDLGRIVQDARRNGRARHVEQTTDYVGRPYERNYWCPAPTLCDDPVAFVEIPWAWEGYGADLIAVANSRYLRQHYGVSDYVMNFDGAWFVDVRKVTDDNVRDAVSLLDRDRDPVLDYDVLSDVENDWLFEYFDMGCMSLTVPDGVETEHLMDAAWDVARETGDEVYTVDGDSVYVYDDMEEPIIRRACANAGVEYPGQD